MLAEKSEVFFNMFFKYRIEGNLDNPITDFDLKTFKLFLNVLMGFEKYTQSDALIIFPIAHKYQVGECLEKCIEVLNPTELSENVILTLNMSLSYNCNYLTEKIMGFLKSNNFESKLLHSMYWDLLEPEAVLCILNYCTKLNYEIITNVCSWGERYLKKTNSSLSLTEFFSQNQILAKITLSCFNTIEELFQFIEDKRRSFFTSEEILTHLKMNVLLIRAGEWLDVVAGETVTEIFSFDPYIPIVKGFIHKLVIIRNEFDVYETKEPNGDDVPLVSAKIWHRTMGNTIKELLYGGNEHRKLQCFKEYSYKLKPKIFYRIPIDPYFKISDDKFCIMKLEISYHFSNACKIYKTSPKDFIPMEMNPGNKYFTYDIKSYFDL